MYSTMKNLLAAALLLAASAAPAFADSYTLGGVAFKVVSSGDASCANHDYGVVANTCTTSKAFIVTVPYTAGVTGTRSISLQVRAATAATDVSCKATAVLPDQSGLYATAYVSPTNTTAQSISIGSVNVPAGGQLYVLCNLAQNARVISVTYSL